MSEDMSGRESAGKGRKHRAKIENCAHTHTQPQTHFYGLEKIPINQPDMQEEKKEERKRTHHAEGGGEVEVFFERVFCCFTVLVWVILFHACVWSDRLDIISLRSRLQQCTTLFCGRHLPSLLCVTRENFLRSLLEEFYCYCRTNLNAKFSYRHFSLYSAIFFPFKILICDSFYFLME